MTLQDVPIGPDGSGMRDRDGMPATTLVAPARKEHVYAPLMRALREPPAPLLPPLPGMGETERLRIAMVIPYFQFGSGGHSVLFQVIRRLEQRGHICTVWLEDPFGYHPRPIEDVRRDVCRDYAGIEAPFFAGFDDWMGADVVIATGWQTVFPVLGLPGCRARVYMVNDHEPEFYATSIETHLAAATYRLGLPCLVGGGRWMADVLRDRYGVQPELVFPYGIDDDYRPREVVRRDDTIVLYGRAVTPRRVVGLGLMALSHVLRRHPEVRVVIFGDEQPAETDFPYEHIGLASPSELSWLYSEATVGLAFSQTNSSLVPQDMMACGLPVVDLAGFGTEGVHGPDGPVTLTPFDDLAMAAAIERLLEDPAERRQRSLAGLAFAEHRTWDVTTTAVEAGLRAILRAREPSAA